MEEKKTPKDIRDDLAELFQRQTYLYDENRKESVKKRHEKGLRTARENIADLVDKDSFIEYGSLAVAAQQGRMSKEELITKTPADGLVMGIGEINGDQFDKESSKCIVLSYDYTVLAGTQGAFNHKKTDRMLQVAKTSRKPVVFFVEGGGGRPGDVDFYPITLGGLDLSTFVEFARLNAVVPRVAIASGYCFAGNAVLAGCADVIIATENTSLGMGGPSMIEGGGLGVFHPAEIGPAKEMATNGVVDILVKNEQEAVAVSKKYLSYFQGNSAKWSCADQTVLRDLIPENRKYAYDVIKVISGICDDDSALEIRKEFARNVITTFGRIEGRPVGIIANSTRHLGGAIDSDASDKLARFMQLCDAFNIPIISLCDAPGFMVGPECEKTSMVRHASRLYVAGAMLRVPLLTIVLRKAYGLGAMAMAGGSMHESFFTVAWPTGEFGGMGLEGAVKLGFKKELENAGDEAAQEALFEKLVKEAYTKGKAINAAPMLEFDEVIDPKNSRKWVVTALESIPKNIDQIKPPRFIDTW